MGLRGPAPLPTAVLKQRGTFRKDRSRNEPLPDLALPECLDWLDVQAKEAWAQLLPQLDAMNVLAHIDANALARYCQYWSRWKKAEEFLQKHGDVYPLKDGNGKTKCLQAFPQVTIASKLGALLTRLEAEFGMTPSARSRIVAHTPHDEEDAECAAFEDFLRRAPRHNN